MTNLSDQPQKEMIELFLHNQTRELELKAQDNQLRTQLDSHNFQFAMETLKAKSSGQTSKFEHERKALIIKFGGWISALLVIVGLIGYAIHAGQKDIAMEIIKAVILLGAGGVGGYGYGRSSHPPSKDPT